MKGLYLLAALVVGGAIGYGFFAFNHTDEPAMHEESEISRMNCLADDCLEVDDLEYPAGNLPYGVSRALARAIEDEYRARATYEAVIEKFGAIRPFIMIKGAEEQHIASLKSIYDKYGLTVPSDENDNIEVPETVEESCQLGVDAEIANAALYRDELIPATSGYEDIIAVFENLMNASQQKHLPAFDRCN